VSGVEIPGGWRPARLPDIVFFQEGPGLRTYQYRNSGIPFLNIRTFVDERIDKSLCKYLDPAEVNAKYKHFLAKVGDVLVATSGSLGKMAIVREEDPPVLLNTSIMRFRSLDQAALDPRFKYWFLRSDVFFTQASSVATGSAQLDFGPPHLRQFVVPLPPPDDQSRIAKKLDRLFNRSKSARKELARVPALFERYKIAIMAAAFRGDTTVDWLAAHPAIRSTPLIVRTNGMTRKREGGSTAAETSIALPLPRTWRTVPVELIGEVILRRQRSPENHRGSHMRPYVRAANITWDGWDLSDVKEMNFEERDFKKFKLQPGDVLINEGSGSADEVGKPAVWNGEINNCCFQNTLIAVRPNATTPEYLYFVLLNAALSRAFVDEARGVNIHHIGRAGLAQFVIPVPPSEEQDEIVRRIKAAFSAIDKLAAKTSRATELLDRLDHATLAKAFRGELGDVSRSRDALHAVTLDQLQKP
jgi:type I restriction enzyme S subunit